VVVVGIAVSTAVDITVGTVADGGVESRGVNTAVPAGAGARTTPVRLSVLWPKWWVADMAHPLIRRYRLPRNPQASTPRRGTRPVLVATTSPYGAYTGQNRYARKELKS